MTAAEATFTSDLANGYTSKTSAEYLIRQASLAGEYSVQTGTKLSKSAKKELEAEGFIIGLGTSDDLIQWRT